MVQDALGPCGASFLEEFASLGFSGGKSQFECRWKRRSVDDGAFIEVIAAIIEMGLTQWTSTWVPELGRCTQI